MDEFVRMVKGFQVADKNDVAMPANWPNNELIQDKIIIPLTPDEKTARKQTGEYECYGRWLCYENQ
jgi:peroxiredoxin (alkyl hydroperoxide reductase subunit C)